MTTQDSAIDLLWNIKTQIERETGTRVDYGRLLREREYRDGILSAGLEADSAHLAPLISQYYELEQRDSAQTVGGSALGYAPRSLAISNTGDSETADTKKTFLISGLSLVFGFLFAVVLLLGIAMYAFMGKDVNPLESQTQLSAAEAPSPPPIARSEPHSLRPLPNVNAQSSEVAAIPTDVAPAEITYTPILRLHGSNTVGESLAPSLFRGYFNARGAKSVQQVAGQSLIENELRVVFADDREPASVEIQAHGSSTAFRDLSSGRADMGMSSRPIKQAEVSELRPLYGDLSAQGSEIVIALDGLAVIVHPANPVTALTTLQVAQLFSGEIDDWSALGQRAGPVTIYARDENSGTWDTFKNLVLKKNDKTLAPAARRFESSSELSDLVAEDINGIGFIGLPYIRSSKALAIADGQGVAAVIPTSFTVSTEDYPLSRRLFFYVPQTLTDQNITQSKAVMRDFVRFVTSEDGQNIVRDIGFVSQNIRVFKPKLGGGDYPADYLEQAQGASRLSLNFRFALGSSRLDNKALADLGRLVRFMEQQPGKKLMLFGFTDNVGDPATNEKLSRQRAATVEQALVARGLIPDYIGGFGEQVPVANNDYVSGQNKNRRVEVWIK